MSSPVLSCCVRLGESTHGEGPLTNDDEGPVHGIERIGLLLKGLRLGSQGIDVLGNLGCSERAEGGIAANSQDGDSGSEQRRLHLDY